VIHLQLTARAHTSSTEHHCLENPSNHTPQTQLTQTGANPWTDAWRATDRRAHANVSDAHTLAAMLRTIHPSSAPDNRDHATLRRDRRDDAPQDRITRRPIHHSRFVRRPFGAGPEPGYMWQQDVAANASGTPTPRESPPRERREHHRKGSHHRYGWHPAQSQRSQARCPVPAVRTPRAARRAEPPSPST